MASEVTFLLEDGWVDSMVSDVAGPASGGISTSSTEAKEKDSFSDTVAPNFKKKKNIYTCSKY